MENYDFDTILFPVNFVCWFQGNFGPHVVSEAKKKNMGILALKGLAFTRIEQGEQKPYEKLWYKPIEDDHVANLSLRFTLSQGTTAAIPPGDARFFWKALEIAEKFSGITNEEIEELKTISKGVKPIFKT